MVATYHYYDERNAGLTGVLLRELDDDYFGAQDDSDASAAVASPGAEYHEYEEPSSDENASAARCVDLGASLVHI